MRLFEIMHKKTLYTIDLDKIIYVSLRPDTVSVHFGSHVEFFDYNDPKETRATYDKIVKAMKKDK